MGLWENGIVVGSPVGYLPSNDVTHSFSLINTKGSRLANFKSNYYKMWELLTELSSVLGLKEESLEDRNKIEINKVKVNFLIEERSKAKISKDFVKSDQIRDKLKDMGITVVDKKGGLTEWFLN